MQGWIYLQEDCGIAVTWEKVLLWHKDHTSYLIALIWKVPVEIYKQHEEEKDKYNQKSVWMIDIRKSSLNLLVFATSPVEFV